MPSCRSCRNQTCHRQPLGLATGLVGQNFAGVGVALRCRTTVQGRRRPWWWTACGSPLDGSCRRHGPCRWRGQTRPSSDCCAVAWAASCSRPGWPGSAFEEGFRRSANMPVYLFVAFFHEHCRPPVTAYWVSLTQQRSPRRCVVGAAAH
jgi:hypothetical protein